LVGISTEGKLGDNQEMVNHFKLFNLTLADKRELLLRGMKKAFPQFSEESLEMEYLNLFSFIPESVIARLSDAEVREIYDVAQMEVEEVAKPEINEAFRNITMMQLQRIQGIIKRYNKGTLTEEQARQLLISGFGMTAEQADVWIITPEEDGVID
jgi:hypothetical protein